MSQKKKERKNFSQCDFTSTQMIGLEMKLLFRRSYRHEFFPNFLYVTD